MKLVLCHYHLNRGGISRVIENHLRSLATLDASDRPTSVIVAYGGRAADWNFEFSEQLPFEVKFAVVPTLEYDAQRSANAGDLMAEMQDLLAAQNCDPASTVLHVHNHSLGKNAAILEMLSRFANDGWRLLLQLHDFAEDLRPQNYVHLLDKVGGIDLLHAVLYPQAKNIHYATLNLRDFKLLTSAGISADRMHNVPNPVVSHRGEATQKGQGGALRTTARQKLAKVHGISLDETYVLYPVRAIQRKNLGELLLWATVCDATFAVTLPPLNPREVEHYESWKVFAQDLSLKVLFEAGEELSLEENYAAADAIITTSVAEGFGLVFLEAALMRRPLVGRNLPGITDDFLASGVQLPGLVDSIRVPASWVNKEALQQLFVDQLQQLRVAFRLSPIEERELRIEVNRFFEGETIDFGRLDLESQKKVLCDVSVNSELRKTIQDLNPVMQSVGPLSEEVDTSIETSCRIIEERYSLETIGRQLNLIYGVLLDGSCSPVESRPDIARELQQSFLHPKQLFPLRLET